MAAAIAAYTLGGAAAGDILTFVGGVSGDSWGVAQNWVDSSGMSGVPDGDDRAVIPPGKKAVIFDGESYTVDTVQVELDQGLPRGVIEIKGTGRLTLENDDKNITCPNPPAPACPSFDNSLIDGDIHLDIDGGVTGTLAIAVNDHTFGGVGSVWSLKSTHGTIEIGGDLRLTNRLGDDPERLFGIWGTIEILGLAGQSGDGEIRNEGVLRSVVLSGNNDPAVDSLIVDAELSDDSRGWYVADCGSWIIFARSATLGGTLRDDFQPGFGGGTFLFKAGVQITTCGTYQRVGCGGLEFESGATFRYAQFDDLGEGCSPPSSGTTLWSSSCNANVTEVSSSESANGC